MDHKPQPTDLRRAALCTPMQD